MNSFLEALSGDKSKKEKTSTSTNNADSVIVGSDAENNVVIIHNLSSLGGNLLRPDDNIVGAVGMGSNPIGVSIPTNSFYKQVKLSTPGLEKYKVINAKTNDPLKLPPIAIDPATKFDDENNGERQLAIEHTGALANLMWSMNKEKVPLIEFVPRPDGEAL